jgi:hypothetical protein
MGHQAPCGPRADDPAEAVVTAVRAHPPLLDGLEVVVQRPHCGAEEMMYGNAPAKVSDEQMEAARARLLELVHEWQPQLASQKRTEVAVAIAQPCDSAGHVPQAASACAHGFLTPE